MLDSLVSAKTANSGNTCCRDLISECQNSGLAETQSRVVFTSYWNASITSEDIRRIVSRGEIQTCTKSKRWCRCHWYHHPARSSVFESWSRSHIVLLTSQTVALYDLAFKIHPLLERNASSHSISYPNLNMKPCSCPKFKEAYRSKKSQDRRVGTRSFNKG